MLGKRIIFYLLGAFIAGNVLLIYIQYNSTKNVNSLISGNEKVISELKVRSDLRESERDITSVESKITGTLYTRDSTHLEGLGTKIKEVQHDIDNLQKISDDDTSVKYIDVLDLLVHRKLLFGRQVLDTLYKSGKLRAEQLISSDRAKQLNDSIKLVTRIIENSRQKVLARAILSINKSGEKALNAGTMLIVFVLFSGAVLFWFIISVMQKQNQLIVKLNTTDKKVREAAQVKENFLANMSHEIRTPVNAILGFTNLLQRRQFDKESSEYIQTIKKSSENLLNIINDILDLSKIEAGMMRIESAPFSIRNLLHSVKTMFKSKIVEKKLQFFIDIDATLPDVLEGDATRLTQILINLISNALKFTAKGTISIKITNEEIIDNTVKTGITITDTGIGIEKEKLGYIFERFRQAEDSVTRKYGGTGLGLSIVNDLVLLQQGSINVESEPHKGTTFHLTIPYKISANDFNNPSPNNKSLDNLPAFKNINILVAEDNAINQTLVRHLFQSWNLNFNIVSNGEEAVKEIQLHTYDLILMDIQMPEMDGYTATMEIRNKLKLGIPIIAMTAHALRGEKEKCLNYGMNEYISKPIDESKLLALIEEFTAIKYDRNSKERIDAKYHDAAYKYIDLKYMQEVSLGNIDYEKIITEQFIEAIPSDLTMLEKSWQLGDIGQLRQSAHNMKTSISVMGLNGTLENSLDVIEYEQMNEACFHKTFSYLEFICKAALEEAKHLYTTFK
jgi:signal transduction histidine kinase/CheY-like chemotaxis protein